MAKVIQSERFALDLLRIADFLREASPEYANESIDLILDGVSILARHPWIGRPVEENLRELLIGQGRKGYIALYDYLPDKSQIHLLAVRHQRELSYSNESDNH